MDKLNKLQNELWDYAELGFKEYKSAKAMCDFLEEEGFEFFIEGEHMFLRTSDDKNVYRLYDKSVGGSSTLRNSITLLPRTTDAQDLIPMILNGEEPKWN